MIARSFAAEVDIAGRSIGLVAPSEGEEEGSWRRREWEEGGRQNLEEDGGKRVNRGPRGFGSKRGHEVHVPWVCRR